MLFFLPFPCASSSSSLPLLASSFSGELGDGQRQVGGKLHHSLVDLQDFLPFNFVFLISFLSQSLFRLAHLSCFSGIFSGDVAADTTGKPKSTQVTHFSLVLTYVHVILGELERDFKFRVGILI